MWPGTAVGRLVGLLGLMTFLAACAMLNPFERPWPPDAIAWDEAQRANSPYFYARFLAQYPNSAFVPQARTRLEALTWEDVQKGNGPGDYARFIRMYPDSVWVPQAWARLATLEQERDRRQHDNERVNCPQLEDRVRAYTAAVQHAVTAMQQLPPDKQQTQMISNVELPQLREVFHAIEEYRQALRAVRATYGNAPACHTPHQEIAYYVLPTAHGPMFLEHIPIQSPLNGRVVWRFIQETP